MARFPYVPGAGAKRIGNPVYWSRMTLQNQRYKKTSQDAEALWHHRYKVIWKYYDIIWDDELEKVKEFFSEQEEEKFGDLNHAFKTMDQEIVDHPYLDNGLLNKLKTRIKNLILFLLKMCAKYEIYNDLHSVKFDSKLKAFVLNGDENNTIYGLW
jgi:hypothetical protein|tara:strand:- start:95 stop:559 length:465 start_codon:yes stop_codon:yes gene_type:complete